MGLLKTDAILRALVAGAGLVLTAPLYAEDGQRRIEEVVVTAEKVEVNRLGHLHFHHRLFRRSDRGLRNSGRRRTGQLSPGDHSRCL